MVPEQRTMAPMAPLVSKEGPTKSKIGRQSMNRFLFPLLPMQLLCRTLAPTQEAQAAHFSLMDVTTRKICSWPCCPKFILYIYIPLCNYSEHGIRRSSNWCITRLRVGMSIACCKLVGSATVIVMLLIRLNQLSAAPQSDFQLEHNLCT